MNLKQKTDHWIIGEIYLDNKNNTQCILLRISPYKYKNGSSVSFRYINTNAIIRINCSKALGRFSLTQPIGNIETPKPRTKNVPIQDDNVFYVDFKNKTYNRGVNHV